MTISCVQKGLYLSTVRSVDYPERNVKNLRHVEFFSAVSTTDIYFIPVYRGVGGNLRGKYMSKPRDSKPTTTETTRVSQHEDLPHLTPWLLCSWFAVGLGKESWLAGRCHGWPRTAGDGPRANQGQTACQLGTEDSSAAGPDSGRTYQDPKEKRAKAWQQGT